MLTILLEEGSVLFNGTEKGRIILTRHVPRKDDLERTGKGGIFLKRSPGVGSYSKQIFFFRQVLKFLKSCFYNVDTWGGTNEAAINT